MFFNMTLLGLSKPVQTSMAPPPPKASGPCGPGSPFCRYPDAFRISWSSVRAFTHQTTGKMPPVRYICKRAAIIQEIQLLGKQKFTLPLYSQIELIPTAPRLPRLPILRPR